MHAAARYHAKDTARDLAGLLRGVFLTIGGSAYCTVGLIADTALIINGIV
jgi:hypothetical protein